MSYSFNKIYILLFFLSAGIFLNFIIPPFQNPDEPQHFGAILTYSADHEKKDLIEKEIIKFMDKNACWKYLGIGKPVPIPESFSRMPYLTFIDFKGTFGNIAFYHFLLNKAQKILAPENVISSYYICRFISILLITGSLFFLYLTFSKISHLNEKYFFYGIFFGLFLPQLLTISVSVSPDVLSIFLSSLFFYASFSIISEKIKIDYLIILYFTSIVAFFTEKTSFYLIILILLIPFFLIERKNFLKSIFLILAFFLIIFLLTSWIAWFFPSQFYNSLHIAGMTFTAHASKIPQLLSLNEFNKKFFLTLSDSFLLKFGWMAFGTHKIFYYIWRILILFSLFGIIVYFGNLIYSSIKSSSIKYKSSTVTRLTLFSLLPVIIQIIGIWLFLGTRNDLPQGRYMFPLLLPIAFIFVLGLKTFFDMFHKKGGLIAISLFLIAEFIFLNYALWNYVIPVFHLTVKSPHPGI